MAVYVDDMMAPYGRMKMCHMVADTDEELHAMADLIGVQRKWFQHPGTWKRHYDVAVRKRTLAIGAGAVQVTQRQLACMTAWRHRFGTLGKPDEAWQWFHNGRP